MAWVCYGIRGGNLIDGKYIRVGAVCKFKPRLNERKLQKRVITRCVNNSDDRFVDLPSTVVHLHDSKSGCDILVIGCVHGSFQSAADVEKVFELTQHASHTSVVLELCDQRLKTLRAPVVSDSKKNRNHKLPLNKHIRNFGGIGPGILAFILSSFYRIHTAIGLEPGIEFRAAVEYAKSRPNSVLICGDATAVQTIRRLYSSMSPATIFSGLPEAISRLFPYFFGSRQNSKHERVNFFQILSEKKRVQEMSVLLLPVFLFSVLFIQIGSGIFEILTSSMINTTHAQASPDTLYPSEDYIFLMNISENIGVAFIVLLSCIWVIRFFDEIVIHRDLILYESIQNEIQSITRSRNQANITIESPVVIAVVGLLHVNGIVQHFTRNK